MQWLRRSRWAVLAACLIIAASAVAITVMPVKVKCPVCGEVNDFYTYASWGSYVYSWPSKYQMVFWPQTDSTSMYICKKCHFTAWMWDFKDLKPEKVEDARKAASAFGDLPKFDKYEKLPMSQRLSVAERVYQTLGRDDDFWSQFYRVRGYHLAREGKSADAQQARTKARDLLTKLSVDPANANHKKDLLVALAAMQHFLGDDETAVATLAQARKETISVGENAKGHNDYLDQLISDYADKIKSKTVPADDKD
jgi:hypothetical protein